MTTEFPTDFHNRAVHYRELVAHEENDARATVLVELANLFDRMDQDFADYFLRHSPPTRH